MILHAIDEDAVTDSVKIPVPPPAPERSIYSSAVDTPSNADIPFASIAAGFLGTFAIGTFAMRKNRETEASSSTSTTPPKTSKAKASLSNVDVSIPYDSAALLAYDVDISVPYDAAAILAYDEWRQKHNKGDFDASKFIKFKSSYEKISVANVVAKKVAREKGTTATLKFLDDKADK